MVLAEQLRPEAQPTVIGRITNTLTIKVENPDTYGGHLQHYEAQEMLGNQREKIIGEQTDENIDPVSGVRSVYIRYKQQLFEGEEVEVVTELYEPDPNQQGLTFSHQIMQNGKPVIIATVSCGHPDQRERIDFQKELEGLKFLTGISTKGPVGKRKDIPHYTDSQVPLNRDRIDIFESCGMELREAAEKTNLFGFITTMKIEYLEQPSPNDEVEIITDVYRYRNTIFRFHQRIIKRIKDRVVVITESITNCAIVDQVTRRPRPLPKELLAKLKTHNQINLLLESANYPELEGVRQLFKLGKTKEALRLLENWLVPEPNRTNEILSSPEKYYQSRADTDEENRKHDEIKLIAGVMAAMNDDYRGLTQLAKLLEILPTAKQIIISGLLAQLTEWAEVKVGRKDNIAPAQEEIQEWAHLIREGKVKLTLADEKDETQNST